MRQSTNMMAGAALGAAVGAAAMYLLDPNLGKRRRAVLQSKVNRVARVKREQYDAALRDAKNRLVGLWHETAHRFSADDVSDEALTARVRAAMGRVVSHPKAIDVECVGGCATLRGDVLADEVVALIDAVRKVRGVDEVTNECVAHTYSEGVPALQGLGRIGANISRLHAKPGPALAIGAAGLGLALFGAMKRGPVAKAIGATGLGLAAKAMRDLEGKRLASALELEPEPAEQPSAAKAAKKGAATMM